MINYRQALLLLPAAIIGLELTCASYLWIKLGNLVTPSRAAYELLGKFWSYSGARKCPTQDPWASHPYLGYARHVTIKASDCLAKQYLSNNRGMVGPDYPERRDPESFVIMLTGGSFAERFGLARFYDKFYFESMLNERFHPPHGKKFKLIIGAHGDYRMPQNLIAPLLNHDIVDAVIDISGFNEFSNYQKQVRLESPSQLYWDLFRDQQLIELKTKVRSLVLRSEQGICQYSFACVVFTQWQIQYNMQRLLELRTFNQQQKIFQYPQNVQSKERWKINQLKHQGYYRGLRSLCEVYKWYCSFFIQPIPQLEKVLTPEEKSLISTDLKIAQSYKLMASELAKISGGPTIHSLIPLFASEQTTVYMDYIHITEGDERPSRGQQLLAEQLLESIRIDWKLRPKPNPKLQGTFVQH